MWNELLIQKVWDADDPLQFFSAKNSALNWTYEKKILNETFLLEFVIGEERKSLHFIY